MQLREFQEKENVDNQDFANWFRKQMAPVNVNLRLDREGMNEEQLATPSEGISAHRSEFRKWFCGAVCDTATQVLEMFSNGKPKRAWEKIFNGEAAVWPPLRPCLNYS